MDRLSQKLAQDHAKNHDVMKWMNFLLILAHTDEKLPQFFPKYKLYNYYFSVSLNSA